MAMQQTSNLAPVRAHVGTLQGRVAGSEGALGGAEVLSGFAVAVAGPGGI